ncbi:MAG TPA: hypothetical protein VMD53_16225 [Rhizomicrobium sp.]|nr:hypothetical protein [Rhizomicrobium sp.]
MDDGATGPSRDAAVSLFGPARNTILLLLGMAALAAPALSVAVGQAPGLGFSLRFAAMLVASALIALSQFRDPLLAAAGTLAPLPGVSLVFCGTFGTSLSSTAASLGALVYALGFSVALISGDGFAQRVADGEAPQASAMLVLQNNVRFLGPVLVVALGLPGLLAVADPQRVMPSLLLAGGNALAALSAWAAVPLAGSFLAGGEDFIARTNRTREGWTRRFERIASVARPPWAMSATGILVVLLVLGTFGSAKLDAAKVPALRLDAAAAGFVIVAAALLAGRDWRRTLAIAFAATGTLIYALWGYSRGGAAVDAPLLLATAGLCAICFAPVAAVAAGAALSGRSDAASASEAGILGSGPVAATGILGSLILLTPWYREFGAARAGFVLAILFAAAGALVFHPAVASVLEDIVPRRQTLAERYRVK